MYTSRPRTFSRISQNVSASLKRDTRASPSGVSRTFAISLASSGFAFPVKMQTLLTAKLTSYSCYLNPRKYGTTSGRAGLGGGQLAVHRLAVNDGAK